MTPAPEAQTIFALSTGAPPAAIAIVRISGSRAGEALQALAGRLPKPRFASVATLRDPGDGVLLDRALLLWQPGPRSATGEDLAELHLHGGRAIVTAVLGALGRLPSLRVAEPGEFTRRAFENRRIDLLEAEGLADLLTAETEGQRRQAITGAEGHLSRLIAGWRTRIVTAAAAIEAALGFDDDDDTIADVDFETRASLAALLEEIDVIVAAPPYERLGDGTRIVIAGPPNAGKSTLFNALVGREAAIVSPLPGTTRDSIEASIVVSGTPVVLCDTAGLRDSDDVIETLGVARANERIAAADIVIWLGPVQASSGDDRRIAVAAKCDLGVDDDRAGLRVSSLTGEGLKELRAAIDRRVASALMPSDQIAMLNRRQRSAVGDIRQSIAEASNTDDPLVAAEELKIALSAVERLSGGDRVEDVLDAVFSRFCVGK